MWHKDVREDVSQMALRSGLGDQKKNDAISRIREFSMGMGSRLGMGQDPERGGHHGWQEPWTLPEMVWELPIHRGSQESQLWTVK